MTQFAGPPFDVDKYELIEVRSSGAEGELWRGSLMVDSLPVPVAVKVVHPSHEDDIETWHQRWLRQAEILKSISHPGLVSVREVFLGPYPHEKGAADNSKRTLYLIMNWVEGPSLPEWDARNPDRDVLQSLRLVVSLAQAVDYLHSGGGMAQPLIHRDIKPGNVIVTDRGIKLVDFGFVRATGSNQPMTLVGSPSYVAPEVAVGLNPTEASDRFSLGATAFFAVTGEAPNIDDPQAMRARLNAVYGLEDRPDLHEHLLAMVDRTPEKRPSHPVEWANGLATRSIVGSATEISPSVTPARSHALGDPAPSRKKRRRGARATTAVLGILLLIGGGWWALGLPGLSDAPPGPGSTVVDASGTTVGTTTSDTTVSQLTMPSIIGMTEEEALALLGSMGITNVLVEPTPSQEDPGLVLQQSPEEGTELASGSEVLVTVSGATTVEVPDVVGDSSTIALGVLEDLGMTDIEVTESDWAGDAGLVIEQIPEQGTEADLDDPVLLIVSREAPTPDFSQVAMTQAQSMVDPLGAEIQIETEYNPEMVDGVFIRQLPEPGASLTETVIITVSEGPASLFLEELEPVVREISTSYALTARFSQGDVNGTRLTHALVVEQGSGGLDTALYEYNLSRVFDRLKATVGYSDNHQADGSMRLEIFGDGVLLFSDDYRLGIIEEVLVDVTGVLRLRLLVTTLCCNTSGLDEALIVGDLALMASRDVVADYTNQSSG